MPKVSYVFWKDKIGGEVETLEEEIDSYGYRLSGVAEWVMAIANENKEVKKDNSVNIKIEPVEFPEGAVAFPCSIMRHALGVVIGVHKAGTPKHVESVRTIDEAIFFPIKDGEVKKGDLLSVINVIYVGVKEREIIRDYVKKIKRFR